MSDLTAYTGTWTIDPAHTTVGFTARHAMVTKVRGTFTAVEGTLTLDGSAPTASKVEATIQAASIDTGNPDRDAHLRSADFFDAERFPTLGFVSSEIRAHRDGFVLVGDLTIRGTTRPVEIEVELGGVATDPFGNVRAGFEGTTQINRKDFGLTWNAALEAGGVLVSDTVKIGLDVSAVREG